MQTQICLKIKDEVYDIPCRLFLPRPRTISLLKFPIFSGSRPVNWLSDSHKVWSRVHSLKLDGIWPKNWFAPKYSASSFGRRIHISFGRVPDRLLELKSILSKEEMLYKLQGMEPERYVFSRCSPLRAYSNSTARLSWKECSHNKLCPKSKNSSIDKLKSESGMGPLKLLR